MEPQRKLRKMFTNTKTKFKQNRIGHIYKINCLDCNNSYVGETGRSKGPRIKEHMNDYRKELKQRNDELRQREIKYKELEDKRTRDKMNELEQLKKHHEEEDLNKTYKTALVAHSIKKNHTFDFDNTKILHQENLAPKRKALESMYITQDIFNTCNFKSDTQYMHLNTKQLIHAYNHSKSKNNRRH